MSKKRIAAPWLKKIAQWLVALSVLLQFIINLTEISSFSGYQLGYAAGTTFWTFIFGFIALICADECSKWSLKIKKNPNIAYIFGFILFIPGLLIYWIYYLVISKINV